jgi:predicted metal-binding membrane protein
VLAAAIFLACGVYQLTPLKDRCLRHCRSPLGLLLHYGNYKGPVRDVRVGVHHGAYCAGCCVGLMALLVAFGLMNLLAMAGLVAVVIAEKYWRYGVVLSRAVGVAALVAAVAVFWVPGLAPGLRHSMPMM